MHRTSERPSLPFRIDLRRAGLSRAVLAPLERALALTELARLHGLCAGSSDVDVFLTRVLVEGSVDLAQLVPRIERDEKGIPVLLREYLKLGGKLIALNVDADFQDALDALIVVDLLEADTRLLERYLGMDGAASFSLFHRESVPDRVAI